LEKSQITAERGERERAREQERKRERERESQRAHWRAEEGKRQAWQEDYAQVLSLSPPLESTPTFSRDSVGAFGWLFLEKSSGKRQFILRFE